MIQDVRSLSDDITRIADELTDTASAAISSSTNYKARSEAALTELSIEVMINIAKSLHLLCAELEQVNNNLEERK